MGRRRRRWAGLAALAAVLTAVSVAVGGAAAGNNAANPLRLNSPGTLVVGMNLQYPPQMYLDKNGNPAGYDVMMLKALANHGLKVEPAVRRDFGNEVMTIYCVRPYRGERP